MTLVSVITPSFNQAAYLEQTIISVLNQDYPRVEYFVIDGAGHDYAETILGNGENVFKFWAKAFSGF